MSRAAARKADSPAAARLREVSGDLFSEARRQIEAPGAEDATAVHEFRKAMKRWRALLRLYEPLFGTQAEQLRIEARDLARELAGTRDARSALDALADLREAPLSERMLAAIRARLEGISASAEAATLTDDLRERMREALDHATTAAMAWPRHAVDFAAVADGLAASYARARGAIPEEWRSASPEALHVLRQRVVVHRYQMELAVPLWPKLGRVWIAEAQKLRDRLGHFQDLAVLQDFIAPRQPLAHWRSRLDRVIVARQAEHASSAERLARRLFAEKPKAFRRRLMSLWDGGASQRNFLP
jgi:CHAD domain-containing protein